MIVRKARVHWGRTTKRKLNKGFYLGMGQSKISVTFGWDIACIGVSFTGGYTGIMDNFPIMHRLSCGR